MFLLAACGGGSGGNSPSAVTPDPADDEASGGETVEGAITGRVLTALDDAPLADAEITLLDTAGATLASTRSGVDGNYRFNGLSTSDVFQILIAFESYLSETYSGVQFASVGAGDTVSVEPVRLVSDDNAGDGSLTGTITGAVDGLALGGLTLEFIRGINNRDGELVATTTTDDDGSYTVSNLPYGNYTCIIVGVGLETTYTTVYVVGGTERGDQRHDFTFRDGRRNAHRPDLGRIAKRSRQSSHRAGTRRRRAVPRLLSSKGSARHQPRCR